MNFIVGWSRFSSQASELMVLIYSFLVLLPKYIKVFITEGLHHCIIVVLSTEEGILEKEGI